MISTALDKSIVEINVHSFVSGGIDYDQDPVKLVSRI